jgi:fructokinase
MAGLINALARRSAESLPETADSLRPAIEQAALVAALTCQRAGADPPTAAELSAAMQGA